MTDWCILTTSAPRTLLLAKSLAQAGFDVWTPTEKVKRRKGSARVRVELDAPITPTFVFARAHHLPDLARIRALPVSPHPSFAIFRHAGRFPILADREIANLRAVEDRAKLREVKSRRHTFPTGERVRITEGPAAGLSGVVEAGDGQFALVAFGAGRPLKIATWLLSVDDVPGSTVPMDTAA